MLLEKLLSSFMQNKILMLLTVPSDWLDQLHGGSLFHDQYYDH